MVDVLLRGLKRQTFNKRPYFSRHTSPFTRIISNAAMDDELAYVLEGEISFELAGKPGRATAGDHAVIPAKMLHAVRAETPEKLLLFGPAHD